MKKQIFSSILFIVICFIGTICAKADKSSVNLHFVYIAHEVTTPINDICDKLRTFQADAVEVDDALIVYLSDGKSSFMSFTNLEDATHQGRDREHAFQEVIAELQDANSHDVVASEDVKNIIQLFDEFNFIDESGNILYNSVVMDFYIGANFWALGNNEKVISHLYQDFGMPQLPKSQFQLNIYAPKTDHLSFPNGKPFGEKNVNGINESVKIFEY